MLFDFDGPVCQLFAAHSAADVTATLAAAVDRSEPDLLTDEQRQGADPLGILRSVAAARPGSPLVRQVEQLLAREERRAAVHARPTEYADPLIRTLASSHTLAITSNNSPGAIHEYLNTRAGVGSCFESVYGRAESAEHLKPDPYCLVCALDSTGAARDQTLMIGDAPADYEAARRAGVGFIGFASQESREHALREAGARTIVTSLEELLEAARTVRH
ncbi:HAD family hydrolase [Streptomyces sp. A7024]|uniref:HAD family hydrolase n=1 Tax=Streptomyces coryli TaxID=1128680 RepID=A0A6G4TX44_9ACTN|nr:HAD family hydrolase [Streptomyces coryli]